ncbi:MAG TPA: urea ABC transporter permease subunit UrtB [Polyangia bacterium]|jgi:urea transport system permease protein
MGLAPASIVSRRFTTGLLALAAFVFVTGGDAGRPAFADTLEEAINGLASTNGERISASVKQLATLGDARGIPALEALCDDRLRAGPDGHAWIFNGKTHDLVDPMTGAVAPPSARPAREVELDNDIRRDALPVLAQLQLSSPDKDVRLAAAEELGKAASDDTAALLHKAFDSEKDKSVHDVLALAVARVDLQSPNPAARLAAVQLVHKSGNDAMLGELQRLLSVGADGKPQEPDAQVRGEAQQALNAVMSRRRLITAVGSVIYGFSLASVLLFAALGLAITFGLLGVINMAHGEMLMLGAYATYAVQTFFQNHLAGAFQYYLVAAIPVAFAVTFAVGVLLEKVVIRHLYNRPLETLLATWGISLILIQTVRLIFGAQNVAVANPDWLAGGVELAHGLVLPYNRIGVVVFVVAVSAAVWVLLYKTRLGLNVRAITQNRNMAACVGIPTKRLDAWMFGLGSGIAGLGGVALSQLGNVGPELGQSYIIDSFMVVVLGGVGRLAGAIVSALGLGIINKLIEPAAGAVMGKIVVLGVVILFIQRRPQGLFAIKGRSEA